MSAAALYGLLSNGNVPPAELTADQILAALEADGFALLLDWKDPADEAATRFQAIAQRLNLAVDAAREACEVDDEVGLAAWLRRAGARLGAHGLVLASLHHDADEFALVLVPEAVAAHVAALVASLPGLRWCSYEAAPGARTSNNPRARPRRAEPAPSRVALVACAAESLAYVETQLVLYPVGAPAYGMGARNAARAACSAGCALATAGEPMERVHAAWQRAASLTRDFFAWQAQRYGYVAPSQDNVDDVAVAALARAHGPLFDVLRAYPLLEEKGVPPRVAFFQRLVVEGLTGTTEASDAERKDIEKYADLTALVEMVEAASRGDAAKFGHTLATWLRTSWSKADRAMRRDAANRASLPYRGPLSPLACLLCARLESTPALPDDVACYVDARVVDAARPVEPRLHLPAESEAPIATARCLTTSCASDADGAKLRAAFTMTTPRSLADSALGRVRTICFGFPGTEEKTSHGAPSFHIRKKMFVMFRDDDNGDGKAAVWVKTEPDEQRHLVAMEPRRYYVPPYVGVRGWVGVRLDGDADYIELAILIESAWALVAPKSVMNEPVRAPPPRRALPRTNPDVAREALERVIAICDDLPGTTCERRSRQATFRVKGKAYAYFLDNHHGDAIVSVCVKMEAARAKRALGGSPKRHCLPTYIGTRGYVGVRLDVASVDWRYVAETIAASWRASAPKGMLASAGIDVSPSERSSTRSALRHLPINGDRASDANAERRARKVEC